MTDSTSRRQAMIAGLVFVPFIAYLAWCAITTNPLGFLDLARERWGLQVLLDLGIALAFGIVWMVTDARKHRITVWPFVIATVTCGSPGLLAYVMLRALPRRS